MFQLQATRNRSRVHPMAFEFPTRDPERLFFPLLHVHDGELHAEATFDHILFAQGVGRARLGDSRQLFDHNDFALGDSMRHRHAGLVVDLEAGLSHTELQGRWPNRDLWVNPPAQRPLAAQRPLDDWGDDEITNS